MHDVLFMAFPILDLVVEMEGELPLRAGQTVPVGRFTPEAGGGANIVFMATRAALDVAHVGAVGDDAFGRMLLEGYKKQGVSVDYMEIIPGFETQKVLVLNDTSGRHAFVSMLEGRFGPMPFLERLVHNCRAVCFSGYAAAAGGRGQAMNMLRRARELGKTVFFDPGPLIRDIPSNCMEEILAATDIIILNDQEAVQLTGEQTGEAAARTLARKVRKFAVVKAGSKGCYVCEPGGGWWQAGFRVPLVDTTGAGDSFLGAFMRGWLDGWDLKSTVVFANAAGAAKTAKPGCGSQVPTMEELT